MSREEIVKSLISIGIKSEISAKIVDQLNMSKTVYDIHVDASLRVVGIKVWFKNEYKIRVIQSFHFSMGNGSFLRYTQPKIYREELYGKLESNAYNTYMEGRS